MVACRMIAFMVLLYGGVHGRRCVIDGLGLYLGVFPGPAPFAITVIPAIFGAVVIVAVPGGRVRCPGTSSASSAGGRAAAGPVRDGHAEARGAARDRRDRRPDRDRPGPHAAIPTCSARSAGGDSTSRCCGRASTRSGMRPAEGRDRDVLLRRDARQRAAAAGRDRRRRRRHDRRVHRVRRARRARRSSRCWPTARSRSGCRRFPARSRTCSCARPSTAGGRPTRRPSRTLRGP